MSCSKCAACGKVGDALKKCGVCKEVAYCGRECQRDDWKAHKKECGKAAQALQPISFDAALQHVGGIASAGGLRGGPMPEWVHKHIYDERLRFKVGDRVLCKFGGDVWDWSPGTIIAVRLSSEAVYYITCDNGEMRVAPEDDDCYVRELPSRPNPKDPEATRHEKELFEAVPTNEDCPICLLRYPPHNETCSLPCCGQLICSGCLTMVQLNGQPCPFCREIQRKLTRSDIVQRLEKRMERGDAIAGQLLALSYDKGQCGLPRDSIKAQELWTKAAKLGSRDAHWNLYESYSQCFKERGVEKDMDKAIYHLEMTAILGDARARCELGLYEAERGNSERAKKHWIMSAASGCDNCLRAIKDGYKKGHVTKDEYSTTLRKYGESIEETESMQRSAAQIIRKIPIFPKRGSGYMNSASERAKAKQPGAKKL